MELDAALQFARTTTKGVIVSVKHDGRPQLSNIVFAVGDDDVLRVSVTDGRAKTANLRRDPRVSLHVTSQDFWEWVVIEGTADLAPVTTEPGDATGQELAEVYRTVAGEHPDWDEYFAAMVEERRLVLRIRPERAYGQLRS